MVFVDDEAAIVVARSVKVHLQSVAVFLEIVVDIAQRLDTGINWNKGKPEYMLKLRCKGAVACLETLRTPQGLMFPGAQIEILWLVPNYKHLD